VHLVGFYSILYFIHFEDGGNKFLQNGGVSLCRRKCPNPKDFGIIGRGIVALVLNLILVSLIARMQKILHKICVDVVC
jgi:hypothetical protein